MNLESRQYGTPYRIVPMAKKANILERLRLILQLTLLASVRGHLVGEWLLI